MTIDINVSQTNVALGYLLQIHSLTLSVDALLKGEVHEEMGGRDPHSVLLNENTSPVLLLWLCMYVGLPVGGSMCSAVFCQGTTLGGKVGCMMHKGGLILKKSYT